MDSNTGNKLKTCRLCLQTSEDVVNVWNTFQNSTIAFVVSKHFWFEIDKNDGLTEWLCQTCWLQIKSFHEFYRRIELFQKPFLESSDNVQKDTSEVDVTINTDASDAATKHDFNIVKCEETDIRIETFDFHINGHDSSEDENMDDEGETENILKNERQCVNKEQKAAHDPAIPRKGGLSSSEKFELEAQIHEMFSMKCDICSDVEFSSLAKAKYHYRNVHGTQGYITCCSKKFTTRDDIKKHIRYHNNPGANLSLEMEDTIPEFFNMKCQICNDVEYKSLLEVRRHYRKIHKTKGYITCCGKKYFKRHLVIAHVLNHTNPDAYRCDECNKSFKSENSLKVHIDNQHIPLDSREFKCSLCANSFNRKSQLESHVKKKHTSKTGEKFPCNKCSKNFRSRWLLSCHIRQLHELQQEFVCEVCARAFKVKQSLVEHLRYDHSSTPKPKAQCNVCGVWVKKRGLSTHVKRHQDSKPINCPICNKVVQTESNLSNHIAYVHSEKRFPCTVCDKVFKSSKNLKEHIAIHTGEDLYSCPYCEKKFKSNANMYSHRKKAHLAEWTRDFPQRSKSDGAGKNEKSVAELKK